MPLAVSGRQRRRRIRTPRTGRIGVDRGRGVDAWLHDTPCLFHGVLTRETHVLTRHGGVEEYLVRSGRLPSLLCELHVEVNRLGHLAAGSAGLELEADPGGGIKPDHDLVGLSVDCAQAET